MRLLRYAKSSGRAKTPPVKARECRAVELRVESETTQRKQSCRREDEIETLHYERRHEERTASMRNSKRIRPLPTHKSQLGAQNSHVRPTMDCGGKSDATPLFPGLPP